MDVLGSIISSNMNEKVYGWSTMITIYYIPIFYPMLVNDDNPFPSGWVHDPQPGRLLTPPPCRSRVRVDLSNKHEIMRIERTITTKHDKYRQCVAEKPISLPILPLPAAQPWVVVTTVSAKSARAFSFSSSKSFVVRVSCCSLTCFCKSSMVACPAAISAMACRRASNWDNQAITMLWGPLKTGDPTLTWSLSARDIHCLGILVLH